MWRFKDLSLSLQMPLVAAGSALIVALSLLWLAATSSAFLQEERERAYGESLAAQVALSVSEPLQRGDLLSARASLQRFIDGSLAGGIEIRDVEGMPMGTAGILDGRRLSQYSAEIRIGNDTAGTVTVSFDQSSGEESRWRFLFSLLALSAALSLLVFLLTRFLAGRVTARLRALESQLALPNTDTLGANELHRLERSVEQLPLDMLRGHAAVPSAATEFQQATVLFVHLASLVRYVDTLGESNLHRYTRRLQQIVQAAAQCYRGELSVVRPFGLLIVFAPQRNAGSEALRAASCARLITLVASDLRERTNLSLELGMALGHCEQDADAAEDIYPLLCLHGVIDELRDACLKAGPLPSVVLAANVLGDKQLAEAAVYVPGDNDKDEFRTLKSLSAEQETLLAHQAQLIIERIKPTAPSSSP